LKKLITFLFFLSILQVQAQHKIGVRAGLNYSNFSGGELELGESYDFSTGFHFGINYTYNIAPNFGIRGELLYLQRGTEYNFVDTDEGVYNQIIPTISSVARFTDIGQTKTNIKISTGYLSIPITAQYQLTEKWEVFGGLSLDLLLNPTGSGTFDYTSISRPDDIFYTQTLDHRYNSDEAGEVSFLTNQQQPIFILVDDTATPIRRTQSAYYKLSAEQKVGNKFKLFDSHLLFGVNYFVSSGFYVGIRGHYGLLDLTNDEMDFSVRELDADGGFITRSDRDKSRSISVSFGFRF